MEQRKKLKFDSIADAVVQMSEGNIGAVSVLTQVLKSPVGILVMLDLDDMNIRGSQIWVAYKDHCGSDLSKFCQEARARTPALIETVNKNRGHGSAPLAVEAGASREHV